VDHLIELWMARDWAITSSFRTMKNHPPLRTDRGQFLFYKPPKKSSFVQGPHSWLKAMLTTIVISTVPSASSNSHSQRLHQSSGDGGYYKRPQKQPLARESSSTRILCTSRNNLTANASRTEGGPISKGSSVTCQP